MNVKQRLCFSIAIAILSATASLAEVMTDYDRNADFSRYKTYSWGNVHTQNPLWVDRIRAAVNSALTVKGWTEVESGGDSFDYGDGDDKGTPDSKHLLRQFRRRLGLAPLGRQRTAIRRASPGDTECPKQSTRFVASQIDV